MRGWRRVDGQGASRWSGTLRANEGCGAWPCGLTRQVERRPGVPKPACPNGAAALPIPMLAEPPPSQQRARGKSNLQEKPADYPVVAMLDAALGQRAVTSFVRIEAYGFADSHDERQRPALTYSGLIVRSCDLTLELNGTGMPALGSGPGRRLNLKNSLIDRVPVPYSGLIIFPRTGQTLVNCFFAAAAAKPIDQRCCVGLDAVSPGVLEDAPGEGHSLGLQPLRLHLPHFVHERLGAADANGGIAAQHCGLCPERQPSSFETLEIRDAMARSRQTAATVNTIIANTGVTPRIQNNPTTLVPAVRPGSAPAAREPIPKE